MPRTSFMTKSLSITGAANWVALNVPLPLWNRNRGGVERASARQRQAKASLLLTTPEEDLRAH
jgi:outer membrane protein TolC